MLLDDAADVQFVRLQHEPLTPHHAQQLLHLALMYGRALELGSILD